MYYALIDSERRIKAASLWRFDEVPDFMAMVEVDGEIPDVDFVDDCIIDANGIVKADPIPREEPEIEPLPTYAELLDAVNTLGDAVAELMDAKEGA